MARVYISSSICDLSAVRLALATELTARGHTPVPVNDHLSIYSSTSLRRLCKVDSVDGIERALSSSRDMDSREREIESCDLFVGIFSHLYGASSEQDDPGEKSFVEREFQYSIKRKMEKLLFVSEATVVRHGLFSKSARDEVRLADLKREVLLDHNGIIFSDVEVVIDRTLRRLSALMHGLDAECGNVTLLPPGSKTVQILAQIESLGGSSAERSAALYATGKVLFHQAVIESGLVDRVYRRWISSQVESFAKAQETYLSNGRAYRKVVTADRTNGVWGLVAISTWVHNGADWDLERL
jgi:hypothetical protein